ncbi:unnamed protein product (macronuclear) [Paramecium tetraurelia]|uniref:Transmembrane protein n=1 Tax=Paramecium tetraurelia TaxID=5888 RepID=A0D487_PARTE|nr:uncharacterized protein GSPATT00013320001 [Paramecium tetraurelia]CAK77854.1 unnamed protein product [Paramecium tetraurelia]|eukprot:XP_001445251.1 hypothetical protein (macronuclear) [Paramecium tetraurelia strain d4-2]
MALTDQLCLGLTILTFLSYIAIDVVLQMQIPYTKIGLPQKGQICPNQYIKYTDSFDMQCVSDCNQKEIAKKQSIHKHLSRSNQPNFIAYENQICLPTLDKNFYQLEPYVEKPIQMYISQSLKDDSLVIICIIFITLAIICGTLAFYRDYAEFIVKISQIVSMILSFAILLILLRKYRSVQEANEILISNDSQYDLSQMAAIMMLNKMDLVYLGLMAFMGLLLCLLIFKYSMDRLKFSVFPLTHWFTISYYKDYLNNDQMDQNEKPKKSSWPLILFQIINFILFYTINMSSLSISQESSQYAFGETSIVFNIVVPTLSFILYLYFAILISLLSEYNLYQRQNTVLPQIGKAGIQAVYLIILFPLNFLRSFLQFFGKDKFSYLTFTTLKQGYELIREQNHNMNQQELSEVDLRSKINLYDQLNKVTHIISVCLALACNFIMLILQQNIPAPFLISLLAYAISYTYYIPIVASPLRYSFFEGQNEMDEHKQQNMKCLLRLLEQNQQ